MKTTAIIIILCLVITFVYLLRPTHMLKMEPPPTPTIEPTLPEIEVTEPVYQGLPPQYTPGGETQKAIIQKLIDPQTLSLSTSKKLRLLGLDLPEQCFATHAAQTVKSLLVGQTVTLEKDTTDTDEMGKLLRYVYVDGELVNDFLIRQGYARVKSIPPDTKYSVEFLKAEQEARENKRGMWKECN